MNFRLVNLVRLSSSFHCLVFLSLIKSFSISSKLFLTSILGLMPKVFKL